MLSKLDGLIENVTVLYVFDLWRALGTGAGEIIAAFALVSVGVVFIVHSLGGFKIPLRQLLIIIAKMALSLLLITSWAAFAGFIYRFVTDVPNDITKVAISLATGAPVLSINDQMDQIWTLSMTNGDRLMEKAGWREWAPAFLALVVYAGTFFSVGYAVYKLIVAKIAIAVLMSLAVFIIVLWNLPVTSNMFVAWLRQAVNAALSIMVIYFIMMLFADIIYNGVLVMDIAGSSGDITSTHVIWVALIYGSTWYVLKQAFAMTTGISQGVALQTMHAPSKNLGRAERAGMQAGSAMNRWGTSFFRKLRS